MRSFLAYLAVGVSLGVAACGSNDSAPPGAGDCTTNCTQPTTGSGSGAGGSQPDSGSESDGMGGSGEDAAIADAASTSVTFNVGRTRDARFIDILPYVGPVRVSAIGGSGSLVSTGDAGVTVSGGTLSGVANGPNWFAVEDPEGTAKIQPTLEPVLVTPEMAFVALRAISTDALTPLLVDGIPWAPLEGHATLILAFTRGGSPVSGASLDVSLPQGATAAYEDNGAYITAMTNPDVSTGADGVALVRDVDNVAAFPMTTELTITYRLGSATLSFKARVAQNFVTWMTVPVP